jgi:hypothetical protein
MGAEGRRWGIGQGEKLWRREVERIEPEMGVHGMMVRWVEEGGMEHAEDINACLGARETILELNGILKMTLFSMKERKYFLMECDRPAMLTKSLFEKYFTKSS